MRRWRNARLLFAAGVLMLGAALPLVGTAGPASASPWPWPSGTAKAAELTATGGGGQALGWATAVTADGNTALIGGPGRDSGTGAAYVFTRTYSGWRQTAELTASGDAFGTSVAITPDGSTALIGAPGHDDAGAAYLFTRTPIGWQQTAELTASDAASGDEFGTSVAISADGNTALVGAYGNNSQTGAAYVFTRTRTGWQQTTELTADDGGLSDDFGGAVAITADGNTALIGAVYHDDVGAAYVFTRTRTGWQQTTELTASDAASRDEFGFSVAITPDGSTALIGAIGNDMYTGAAYVFALSPGWPWPSGILPD